MLEIMLTPSLCEQAGRSTMENCTSVVLVALAMVSVCSLLTASLAPAC